MKIVPHQCDNGCYILHSDDNKFTGAGVRKWIGETHIIWYSGTAEMNDTKACDMIREWVLSEGGKGTGSGMCTKEQSWTEWIIPNPFDELYKK